MLTNKRKMLSSATRVLALLASALLIAGLLGRAEVVLTASNGVSLTLSQAYSPQLGSILDFDPRSGPVFFVRNICAAQLNETDVPSGSVVVFGRFACDEGQPLSRLKTFSDRVIALVELWGDEKAILEGAEPGSELNDLPPRYAYDPRSVAQLYPVVKVHGTDSAGAGSFILNPNNTNIVAVVSYTKDPWKSMYYTPQWIVYEIISVSFFCFYIPQHAIRALILLQRQRRRTPSHQRSLNIQTVMMSAALALGVVRNVEIITQMLRDYGDIWSPELISQLAWGYAYYILLLSMMLLVLFWGDVLKTSRVKLNMLHGFSLKVLTVFAIVAFLVLTTFICLFVYEVPGTPYVRAAGFLLLGLIALFEGIGTIVYGGRLLKQLTDVKPIADRGAGMRSPSVANESELLSTENPAFHPGGNRSSLPNTASHRISLNKFSLSQKNMNSDDTEEKRKMRIASKRAKPLTRLVVCSAVLLLVAVGLSGAASFTSVLNSPTTYIIVFLPLLVCEVIIYSLIIHTMSPIWQERRRRFARSQSELQLSPLSEEGTLDEATPRRRPAVDECTTCLRNWIVL